MSKELLRATLPFYLGTNVVMFSLLMFAFPFMRPGSGTEVIAHLTAVFLLIQIGASSLGIYYLRDVRGTGENSF